MTVGERIKEIRTKLNMSQVAFADKINVSKQTLYKYENGIITNIPSDKIEAAAKLGGVSPAYLMGWEEVDSHFSGKEASPEEYDKLKKNIEKHYTNSPSSNRTLQQVDLFTGKHKIIEMAEDIMNEDQLKEFNRRLNEALPDNLKPNQSTLAAHFDGDDYTESELDEIRQFAEFVKNKRK